MMLDKHLQIIINHLEMEASQGCGGSEAEYFQKFSALVDENFPEESPDRQKALELARLSGYQSLDEIEKDQQDWLQRGYCRHGFEPDSCPSGCGS